MSGSSENADTDYVQADIKRSKPGIFMNNIGRKCKFAK